MTEANTCSIQNSTNGCGDRLGEESKTTAFLLFCLFGEVSAGGRGGRRSAGNIFYFNRTCVCKRGCSSFKARCRRCTVQSFCLHFCTRVRKKLRPAGLGKKGLPFSFFFFFFSGTLSAKPIHTFSRGRTPNLDRLWGRALSWKRRTEFVFVPSKWGKSSTSRAGELRLLLFFVQICKVAPRENRWVNSKRRVAVFKRRKPQPEGIFICAGLLWGGPRCDFTTRCCLFEQVWVNP